jgi:cobalt/nickel transport system ATP-binding protein
MSHHKVSVASTSFSYADGTSALENISFLLHHGESVGIVGANGAGKSTLLKLLTGLIFPREGQVAIGDIQVTKKTLNLIRQSIGFTFQDADHQLFMENVYEDVAFGPRHMGLDENAVNQRVLVALDIVHCRHLMHKPAYRLSGGEKRGVAIATVLAMEPSILMLDEPSVGLDPGSRRRLINLLKGFTHTKIIASHDLDMIYEVCDRVLVLDKGRLVRDDKVDVVLKDEQFLRACSLELPLRFQTIDTSCI